MVEELYNTWYHLIFFLIVWGVVYHCLRIFFFFLPSEPSEKHFGQFLKLKLKLKQTQAAGSGKYLLQFPLLAKEEAVNQVI